MSSLTLTVSLKVSTILKGIAMHNFFLDIRECFTCKTSKTFNAVTLIVETN